MNIALVDYSNVSRREIRNQINFNTSPLMEYPIELHLVSKSNFGLSLYYDSKRGLINSYDHFKVTLFSVQVYLALEELITWIFLKYLWYLTIFISL